MSKTVKPRTRRLSHAKPVGSPMFDRGRTYRVLKVRPHRDGTFTHVLG